MKWLLLRVVVVAVGILPSTTLRAELMCTNGARARTSVCSFAKTSARYTPASFRRIGSSPTLVASSGTLFESTKAGTTPIGISKESHEITGYTDARTLRDTLSHYYHNFSQVPVQSRDLIEKVLNRYGLNPRTGVQRVAVPAAPPRTPNHGTAAPQKTRRESVLSSEGVPAAACRDLNAAICGEGASPAEERTKVTEFLRSKVREHQARTGASAGSLRFAAANPFVAMGEFASFLGTLNQSLSGYLRQSVQPAKDHLLSAIDAQDLPEATKTAMKTTVDNLQVRLLPDLRNPNDIQEFRRVCGPLGLTSNAFASVGSGILTICPGLLLEALALGKPMESALFLTLVHEAGHHIGADIFEGGRGATQFVNSYGALEACYEEHYDRVERDLIGEIVADSWAIEAMVKRMAGFSKEEAYSFIKESVKSLCGTRGDDGHHPAGSFRIRYIVGKNPGILKALKCSTDRVDLASCTISGEAK